MPKAKINDSFKIFIVTVLCLGIFFRFFHLGYKVCWGDEAFSSLRMAGYTLQEIEQQVFNQPAINAQELQKYLQVNSEKTLTDTLQSLAKEDPHHTPLYFILGRIWEQLLGSSLIIQRSLPALISLLGLPAIYWLCLELFQSAAVGWVAMALLAVSPFHVLYAQEVRQYSLWTVLILVSSAALLQAIRLNKKSDWLLYATTIALGFYTHLFCLLVAVGHGIYLGSNVLISKITENPSSESILPGYRGQNILRNYSLSSLFALLLFSPWLRIVVNNFSRVDAMNVGSQQAISWGSLLRIWGINLSRLFIDTDSQGAILNFPGHTGLNTVAQMLIMSGLVFLSIYALYFLGRNTPPKTWIFILTLTGVTFLALAIPDLILGGIRSTNGRYLITFYLGIQLAIAYLITHKILSFTIPIPANLIPNKSIFYQGLLIVLLSSGIFSCFLSSQSQSWWTKGGSYYHPQIVQILNQFPRALLISSNRVPRILSLSYLLKPTGKVQFISPLNIPPISPEFNPVFLYAPPPSLPTEIENKQNYQLETVYRFPPIYQYLEPLAKHSDLWLCKLVTKN